MSKQIKALGQSLIRSGDREHGASKAMLVFWDLSEEPVDNSDREKKLGRGDATHGMAFTGFDKGSRIAELADGLANPTDITARRLFEPDNWALRLHSSEGREKDGVWALRLIADHENKSKEREHRSTMVINECDKQRWGYLQDALWVKDLGAIIAHRETDFDDAGFLRMLYSSDVATSLTRSCVMLNISKSGGYVTDGRTAGMLWHVLHNRSTASGTGTQTQEDLDCSEVVQRETNLRGDVGFDLGGVPASLAFGEGKETDGDILGGMHWINSNSEIPPGGEMQTDPKSNQPTIQRGVRAGIWVWVKKPKEWDWPRPPYEVPPDYPDTPTGTIEPVRTTHGAFEGDNFVTAVCTGYAWSLDVPESIADGHGFDICVNFVIPSAGFGGGHGGEMTLQLDYCVVGLGDDASPAALTDSLTATLNDATYPDTDGLGRAIFRVPSSDLQGKEGGKISFAFYRRGDTDSCSEDLVVIGALSHFGEETAAIR